MTMDKRAVILGLMGLAMIITAVHAQTSLGEIAGPLNFNVSLGGKQTLPLTIVAEGSNPIPYKVILPELSTVANEVTPTVVVSPSSGTLAPNTHLVINVTVYMPRGDKTSLEWKGIMQVIETAPGNSTSGGGASAEVVAGVAKLVTIDSAPAIFNPWDYIIPGAVAVVVIVGLVYYFKVMRKPTKAAGKRAVMVASVAAKKGAAGKSKGAPKKKSGRKSSKGTKKKAKKSTRRSRR
jgi:hypothetical protein